MPSRGTDAEERREITTLKGLRGLMALHVAARHLQGMDNVPLHWVVEAVLFPIQHGLLGHQLFFALSGFGLTYSTLRRDDAGRPTHLAEFLSARCRRLVPPYYAALVLYLIAYWAVPRGPRIGAGEILAHLSLLHGLWPETIASIAGSHWSMSLIFQFYLVFPLLYVMTGKLSRWQTLAGTAAVWITFRLASEVITLGPSVVFGGSIFYRLPVFMGGMEVARWYHASLRERSANFPARAALITAVGLLGVSFAWRDWGPARGGTFFSTPGYAALVVAALASAKQEGLMSRILSHRLLAWLGTVSYSLYLTHELAFRGIKEVFYLLAPRPGLATDAVFVMACMTLAVVLSWGFYHLVEFPLMHVFRRPTRGLALEGPVPYGEQQVGSRETRIRLRG